MTMIKSVLLATALPLVFAGCTSTNPKAALDDVNKTVMTRTGQQMHGMSGDAVNALLQTNLTAQTAVTIALLNNKSLQAEFGEIGISQADLAQASRLHNIQLFGSWRFPNQPPSLADKEYSAAADILDLLPVPSNSLPMVGGRGQYDYVTMGGMFTILKVREELPADGADPGWYKSPPGTLAEVAPAEDLKRDGIELPKDLPKTAASRTPQNDVWCGVPPAKPTLLAKNEINGRIKLH